MVLRPIIRLPREHGLIMIWLCTLLYSLSQYKGYVSIFELLLSLSASLMILFTSDYIINSLSSRKFLKIIPPISVILLLYMPVIYKRISNYSTVYFVGVSLVLLIIFIYSMKNYTPIKHISTIVGSGLIAIHSVILLMIFGVYDINILSIPVVYSMIASSQASIKVLGYDRNIRLFNITLMFVEVLIGFTLYMKRVYMPFVIIILDLCSRLLQDYTNLSSRMSIKHYGTLESIRCVSILTIIGLTIG